MTAPSAPIDVAASTAPDSALDLRTGGLAPALPASGPRAWRDALRRLIRGRPADPAWSRPALLAVAGLAAGLMLWSLTSNGYANTYYASAVYAGSKSWAALFYDAVDLGRYVSVDKPPLSIWMMALSARIFGFSSFSMLLPDALCGVASVLVLHNVVKRTLGHRAAILAALFLALTPVTVLMSRFNNPDALLVLLLVCAAWAATRAIESGRTRHLLLCGALVGLAFNTKMLQAYLIVPPLALAYLVAAPGGLRRRVAQLAAGGAALAAVSAVWVTTMMLIPAGQRPFVGDTTDNSWWTLIFGANGFDRTGGVSASTIPRQIAAAISPNGPTGGFGGHRGALRLFNDQVGGQIAWLLPLALVGLVTGLWVRRRAARTDRARTAYLLWGSWALVHAYVFSFSLTILHPYYTSALAPAVAVLAAGGLVALWDRARTSRVAALVLAASTVGTAALSLTLLHRAPGFVPWLRWTILALAIVAAVLAILRLSGRRTRVLIVGATGLVALVAGPAAYSIATVGRTVGGGDPTAGPSGAKGAFAFGSGPPPSAQAGGGAPGGPPPGASVPGLSLPAGGAPPLFGGGAPAGVPSGLAGFGGLGATTTADKRLIGYLETHRGSAKYLVGVEGSMLGAPIVLSARQPVIMIGGFGGADPAPTVTQLQSLFASGQLRYVLLSPAGPIGAPGAGGSGRAISRDHWISSHCTAVDYSATSAGSGQKLYDCSRAK